MRKKWLLLAGLLMVLTLCAGIASAAENSTTATIDLQFGKQTFTDTVQVEWNERYIYGELDKLYLSEDEFYSYEEEELLFSVCCDRKNARIELYDETDTFISIMYDDGTHGDITANDGVYSCSYVIKTDKVTRISYYAVFGNSRSNDVTAYFYSAPSSNHYSQYEDIITAIKDIERPYTDENGFVLDADSAQQAFKSVLEYLKQEYNKYSIIKLDVTEHTIEFTLPYGLQIFYEPTFKNCLSQGNSTDQIITVLTSNEITLGNLYRHKLREAASELDAALVNYRYDETSDMYDVQDRDVTLFTVCDELLCPNSVILWAGHGGYLREIGCAIGTTEKFTDTTIDKYSRFSIVKNREYVVSGKGIIFFTPAFVRNECNLTGSFVYFQCCHSAERGTDDWMAEACCIDAGADAYAGNLGETEQAYAYGFLYDVIKRM
ncbi:MAG: hypothetical protein Q4F18_13595, partial [Clostridia bacterium]|nr:hypothetical protein [Clostridia bacterium]